MPFWMLVLMIVTLISLCWEVVGAFGEECRLTVTWADCWESLGWCGWSSLSSCSSDREWPATCLTGEP